MYTQNKQDLWMLWFTEATKTVVFKKIRLDQNSPSPSARKAHAVCTVKTNLNQQDVFLFGGAGNFQVNHILDANAFSDGLWRLRLIPERPCTNPVNYLAKWDLVLGEGRYSISLYQFLRFIPFCPSISNFLSIYLYISLPLSLFCILIVSSFF